MRTRLPLEVAGGVIGPRESRQMAYRDGVCGAGGVTGSTGKSGGNDGDVAGASSAMSSSLRERKSTKVGSRSTGSKSTACSASFESLAVFLRGVAIGVVLGLNSKLMCLVVLSGPVIRGNRDLVAETGASSGDGAGVGSFGGGTGRGLLVTSGNVMDGISSWSDGGGVSSRGGIEEIRGGDRTSDEYRLSTASCGETGAEEHGELFFRFAKSK